VQDTADVAQDTSDKTDTSETTDTSDKTDSTDAAPDAGPDTKPGPCDDKKDGEACSAATPCAKVGVCKAGACAAEKVACNDANGCTTEVCDAKKGCVFTHKDGACEDGDACSLGDTCADKACKAGKPKCDDGVACTVDKCDKGTCSVDVGPCLRPPCAAQADCVKGKCDPVTRACVACLVATDCADKGHVCQHGSCVKGVRCTSAVACKATKQVCDVAAGKCVDCLAIADCGTGQQCVAGACEAIKKCASDKVCDAVCAKNLGHCV